MADVQKYLIEFHDKIKQDRFKENETLREKRDRVLNCLEKNWDKIFEELGIDPPKYENFNQGSYDLGTGNIPTDGDYDIDVGIIIKISKDDYPNPVEVKEWIYDALYGHTKRVEFRRPCITVFYQKDEEPIYHVDLAIYCESDDEIYLAKGKQYSNEENRVWEEADPHGLSKLIKEHYDDRDDDKQFRRIIGERKISGEMGDNQTEFSSLTIPKSLKPTRCQFGVTYRVLDIAMPKVALNCPSINTTVGQIGPDLAKLL